VKITRETFAELFGVHLPAWIPTAWMWGVKYTFVDGAAEIEELEGLYGVCSN